MHKRFILLLGVFLGSYVSTAAQTPTPQVVRAQERVASIVTMDRRVPTPLRVPSFQLSESPVKSAVHFNYLFAGAYEQHDSLESLSPVHEVKTLFLTQSILPLVQIWGGRLRFDGFTSTLDMQNVELGPSAAGGLLDYRPPPTNLSRRPSSGRSPRRHYELSLWAGRTGRTPHPDMADPRSDCSRRSIA
jgi:hypothetical protein